MKAYKSYLIIVNGFSSIITILEVLLIWFVLNLVFPQVTLLSLLWYAIFAYLVIIFLSLIYLVKNVKKLIKQ